MPTRVVPLVLLLAILAALAVPARGAAQAARSVADRTERVELPQSDGITLSGRLILPPGKGPFPGVVVLTLAGSDDLVERLNGLGFAVLLPNRRGLGGAPELLLRATFDRLVEDVHTAAAYLRSRPEVDGDVIGLIGQGGETMVTSLAARAAANEPAAAFVVLVGASGLTGEESFRIEHDFLAAQQGYGPKERAVLDRLVTDLDEIVTIEPSESLREFRIAALMTAAEVAIPRDPAALPLDVEGQIHFFSSPWWRDYFMFEPTAALAGIGVPVLALTGLEDPMSPPHRILPGVRAGLARAPTRDATVCLLPGLVQHSFDATTLDAIGEWLRARVARGAVTPRPGAPQPRACIEEKDARD